MYFSLRPNIRKAVVVNVNIPFKRIVDVSDDLLSLHRIPMTFNKIMIIIKTKYGELNNNHLNLIFFLQMKSLATLLILLMSFSQHIFTIQPFPPLLLLVMALRMQEVPEKNQLTRRYECKNKIIT